MGIGSGLRPPGQAGPLAILLPDTLRGGSCSPDASQILHSQGITSETLRHHRPAWNCPFAQVPSPTKAHSKVAEGPEVKVEEQMLVQQVQEGPAALSCHLLHQQLGRHEHIHVHGPAGDLK